MGRFRDLFWGSSIDDLRALSSAHVSVPRPVMIDVAAVLKMPNGQREEYIRTARELLLRMLDDPDEVRVALFKRELERL